MQSLSPIYTPQNCTPAYQLNWSVTLFWNSPQPPGSDSAWLPLLQQAAEPDGVRILEHRFGAPDISQFFISTKPHVAPASFLRSLKGRLQHILRAQQPKAFSRNYAFRSVGASRQDVVQNYIGNQVENYRLVDPMAVELLQQLLDKSGDGEPAVSKPKFSSHGKYRYTLHVVLCNRGRWRNAEPQALEAIYGRVKAVAEKYDLVLGRQAVLFDHLHLEISAGVQNSPESVALAFMNNLAHLFGMTAVLEFSYYVGTIGAYDRNALRPREE